MTLIEFINAINIYVYFLLADIIEKTIFDLTFFDSFFLNRNLYNIEQKYAEECP